jgi:predicted transcriptional regulator
MDVSLTPEQEIRLAELAANQGCDPEELVREAVTRLLEEEVRFAEAVRAGLEAAERGDFVPTSEVWVGVERILQR